MRTITIFRQAACLRLMLGVGAFIAPHLLAQSAGVYPAWWLNQGVLNGSPARDYAAANQGQAKNMALGAIHEFNAAGGAGSSLNALAASLSATTGRTNDFDALSLGQLKALAKPFYDHLAQSGYQGPPLQPGQTYPWDPVGGAASPPPNDYAMANLGQLKYIFSFTIAGNTVRSLPAAWQQQNFGHLGVDPNASNGDGVPYYWKFEYGLDPNQDAATTDTDGDGYTDQQEYLAGTNPLDPSSKPPTASRYAVIDLGQSYTPTFIATNGMILGMHPPIPNPDGDWNSSVPFITVGGYYGRIDILSQLSPTYARWVKGSWQPLVSAAVNTQVSSMNNQGAVVGAGSFSGSSSFDCDVRGLLWTTDPANPAAATSDTTFNTTNITYLNGAQYQVKSRNYTLCTDGSAGDYSYGPIFGFEITQTSFSTPGYYDIRQPPNPYVFPYDIYYFGNAEYFDPSSGAATTLDTAAWTGRFYTSTNSNGQQGEVGTDIFGHQYTNGPEGFYYYLYNYPPDVFSFTGNTQSPVTANAQWLISIEGVWSFALNNSGGPDVLPGYCVNTVKYYPMSSVGGGVLSGGSEFPGSMGQTVNVMGLTHARSSSDDMVIALTGPGRNYVWNIGGGNGLLKPLNDSLLAINTHYITPSTVSSTASPVPDFQILGSNFLWEPRLDGTTGAPLSPTIYDATPNWQLVSGTTFSWLTAASINDSGAIVGTSYASDGPHGVLLVPVEIDGDNDDDGVITPQDRQAKAKHPFILQKTLNKSDADVQRILIIRKIPISGVSAKIVTVNLPGLIVKAPDGTVLMSGTQTESSDIGTYVSQGDYTITVSGTQNCEGTLGLELGNATAATSGSGADPMPIRVLNADLIFRCGDSQLASFLGYNVTHGGFDTGDNLVYDVSPLLEGITVDQFYSLAKTATKRRASFSPTNYMAQRIWEKVYDNIKSGQDDNPSGTYGGYIWNIFSTSQDYVTADCIEWINAQFKRAIRIVHSELTDPDQKAEFEAWYFEDGNVMDVMGPDTISSNWYVSPGAHLFIAALEGYVDQHVYRETPSAFPKFSAVFEGSYDYATDEELLLEERAVLNIFTPKSVLELSPNSLFEEVDY